jgi:hypothetical protein
MKKYARRSRRFRIRREIWIVGGILGLVIVGLVISVMIGNQPELLYVEVGDRVVVNYTLWTADESWNKVEQKDDGEFEILMKEDHKQTGLIYGFWKAVLGMHEGQLKESVLLPACVDDLQSPPDNIHPLAVAGDGWDDREAPGAIICESYGTGELRFTNLIFRIEIIEIIKP